MTEEQDKEDQPKADPPKWEKRQFAINERVKEICHLGIKATELEIKGLMRKLEKLQYGGQG